MHHNGNGTMWDENFEILSENDFLYVVPQFWSLNSQFLLSEVWRQHEQKLAIFERLESRSHHFRALFTCIFEVFSWEQTSWKTKMVSFCREFSRGSNGTFGEKFGWVSEDYIGGEVTMEKREYFIPLSHYAKSFYYRAALCVGEPCDSVKCCLNR